MKKRNIVDALSMPGLADIDLDGIQKHFPWRDPFENHQRQPNK